MDELSDSADLPSPAAGAGEDSLPKSSSERSWRRRFGPAILTLLIGLAVWRLLPSGDRTTTQELPVELDAVVQRMIAAGRGGDVDAFLQCFAEPLRGELRMRLGQAGAAADELRKQFRPLKTVVTRDWRPVSEVEAVLTLERVDEDASEIQKVAFRRVGSVWQIAEMKTVDRFVPEIPYGTRVDSAIDGEASPPVQSN